MNGGTAEHVSVLSAEVLEWLDPRPGKTLVDGTLGGGGHALLLAQRVSPGGLVIGLDLDPSAVAVAERKFEGQPVKVCHGNYCHLPEVLRGIDVELVDGIVLDLGLSSTQLADEERGFSFDSLGPLDLRFNPQHGEPAWRLLNRLSRRDLASILYQFGEERFSRRIAEQIIARRRVRPIRTSAELATLVRASVPKINRATIDPATRTFQALRIAVNEELKSLEIALKRSVDCLRPGGRFAIISFHSLEDRRVKHAFRDDERYEVLTKRPIRPSEAEVVRNRRSRSAKLRIAARKMMS